MNDEKIAAEKDKASGESSTGLVPSVTPSVVGGVGSHDIGGVIDGEDVTLVNG